MDSYGWLSYFIFEHLDADRKKYKEYSVEDFVKNFRVDDILFQEFVDYSLSRSLKMDFYAHENSIKTYLKAALAEQLFGANLHAKIKSVEDTMLQEVIELDSPLVKQGEEEQIQGQN